MNSSAKDAVAFPSSRQPPPRVQPRADDAAPGNDANQAYLEQLAIARRQYHLEKRALRRKAKQPTELVVDVSAGDFSHAPANGNVKERTIGGVAALLSVEEQKAIEEEARRQYYQKKLQRAGQGGNGDVVVPVSTQATGGSSPAKPRRAVSFTVDMSVGSGSGGGGGSGASPPPDQEDVPDNNSLEIIQQLEEVERVTLCLTRQVELSKQHYLQNDASDFVKMMDSLRAIVDVNSPSDFNAEDDEVDDLPTADSPADSATNGTDATQGDDGDEFEDDGFSRHLPYCMNGSGAFVTLLSLRF